MISVVWLLEVGSSAIHRIASVKKRVMLAVLLAIGLVPGGIAMQSICLQ